MQPHRKILPLLPLLLLSGCFMERDIYRTPSWQWASDREDVHAASYVVRFVHGSSGLSHQDRINMKEVFHQLDHPDRTRVRIGVFHAGSIEYGSITQKRLREIEGFLMEQGIRHSQIQIDEISSLSSHGHSVADNPRDSIVIAFEGYSLTSVKCPGWNEVMDGRVPPEGEENFGCSNYSNFIKTVSDPGILVRGEKIGNADGVYMSKNVQDYRTGKLKKLKVEKVSTAGGGGGSSK